MQTKPLLHPNDAANLAMDRLEEATSRVRARRGPSVSDEQQYQRYMELSQSPTMLFDFVSRSVNSTDPEKVRRGAVNYLNEMRKRFGGA